MYISEDMLNYLGDYYVDNKLLDREGKSFLIFVDEVRRGRKLAKGVIC